jgi:hypothetical protein
MGRGWQLVLAFFLAFLVTLLAIQPAAASFHIMQVREVYSGTATNSSYVELQMYSPSESQNLVNGHFVRIYNSSGSAIGTFTFTGNVANGSNQRTILVGDDGVDDAFSGEVPDLQSASFDIPASGGAACFESIDCVAWGNFSAGTPGGVGTPVTATGIPAGMAIRRTITGGTCTNQLDGGDDTNNSASDFAVVSPNPRNNASSIEEGASCTPPAIVDTSIGTKPPTRSNDTSPTFTFTGSPPDPGLTFECRLDNEVDFTSCASPKEYTGLEGGAGTSHTFRVRAVHPTDGTDTTPATYTWTIDTVGPIATITNQPANPSSGASASFSFNADESSTFQCSLEGPKPSALTSCSSGKTYTALLDGSYTFKVLPTDTAGNPGTEDTYTWTVDNSLADTTDPETTILSKPPDPSVSSIASFTYASNEEGSTFECALDGAGFASCPASGVVYNTLANGPHSFQVRATDGSGNTDETPAGYSWQVAVSATIAPPPLLPQAALRPQTTISAKPGAVTRDRTPSFRFRSSVAGSRFQCKVDRGGFKACRSPFTTKPLSPGPHAVQIRAVAGGLVDPTPAKAKFKLLPRTASPRTASTSTPGRSRS